MNKHVLKGLWNFQVDKQVNTRVVAVLGLENIHTITLPVVFWKYLQGGQSRYGESPSPPLRKSLGNSLITKRCQFLCIILALQDLCQFRFK